MNNDVLSQLSKTLTTMDTEWPARFATLQRRIADVSAQNEIFKNVMTDVEAFKVKQAQLLDGFLDHKQKFSEFVQKMFSEASSAKTQTAGVEKAVSEFNSLISKYQDESNKKTDNLVAKINALKQEQDNKLQSQLEAVRSLKSLFDSFKSETENKIHDLLVIIKGVKDNFGDFKKDHYAKISSIDEVKLSKAEFQHEKDSFNYSIKSAVKESQDMLFKHIAGVSDTLNEKISHIKIPATDNLASIDSVNALKDEIKNFTLDVKNAVLKSSVLDLQISQLNKKLDNIQLILQKIELEQ